VTIYSRLTGSTKNDMHMPFMLVVYVLLQILASSSGRMNRHRFSFRGFAVSCSSPVASTTRNNKTGKRSAYDIQLTLNGIDEPRLRLSMNSHGLRDRRALCSKCCV
jgi:hypothetical protein